MLKQDQNLACIFSIIVLFAANIAAQEKNSTNLSIAGHWELIAIQEQSVSKELFSEGIPYLVIENKNPVVSGFSGCNMIRGNILASGDTIQFGNLISSKRYCKDIPENEFIGALTKVNRYKLKGQKLYLLDEEAELLSFKLTD